MTPTISLLNTKHFKFLQFPNNLIGIYDKLKNRCVYEFSIKDSVNSTLVELRNGYYLFAFNPSEKVVTIDMKLVDMGLVEDKNQAPILVSKDGKIKTLRDSTYTKSIADEKYIYTIDERMVREYILEPKEEIDIFEEKIGEVQVSNPELIRKTIEELVEQKLGMPKSIYKSHLILEKSYRYYSKEVVSSFISSLRWDEHQLKNSANILNYIANSKFPEKKQMWKELIDALIINLNTLEKEQLLIVRKIIMEAFIDNIELIKEVFINENMPIISSDEIFNISTITSRINYIKKEAISDSNSEYISKAIVGEYDINSIEEAVQLFDKLINISQSEIVYKKALIFLQINNLINIKIFTKIMELDKDIDETIGQYLDRLDVAIIPNEYYYAIDKRNMKKYISERILLELKNRKYYHSYLLSMSINNRLFEINFCELDKENFVSTMVYFFKNYVDEFNKIRKAFIKAHIFDNETRKLFFAPYLPITFEELLEIQPISVGLQYIDRVRFSNSQEDIELLSKYANSTIKSNEDLLCYVKYICSKEIPFDKTYIRAVFNELDFSKIIFFNLTEEQQTDIVDILTNVFNLIDPKAAIDFMIKVKCPIVKLEKSICSNDGELIDQTIGKEYFSFISDIEHFTKETIEICKNNYFYVSLWEEIENEFLMVNDNISYLISNILRKQTFEFDIDDEGFSVSDYSEVFMNIEECRNIMENNKEFLLYLVKNKGYEEFELETLKPLLKVRQTIDIVKYAFTLMTTQEEKKDYLNMLGTSYLKLS
jgi:hypothetical protein